MQASVALVIPGLCGPSLDSAISEYLSRQPRALEKLLTRARVEPHVPVDLDAVLCDLFCLTRDGPGDLPIAPLTWLADTGQLAQGFMLRADPVHLRADQTRLRLFDSTTFNLDSGEVRELVDAFNEFYAERGWHLEAPLPERWYLNLTQAPDITTQAPMRVAGQGIDAGLPGGTEGRVWHALLNEIQMLFHAHPVNQAREQRGEPVINSIWPWGGGWLPVGVTTGITRVLSGHPLAVGLAQLANLPCRDQPKDAVEMQQLTAGGMNLVVLDGLERHAAYGDAEAWAVALGALESDWFEPLLEQLLRGQISSLVVYPVNGKRYMITRNRLRRFWKRIATLAQVCQDA